MPHSGEHSFDRWTRRRFGGAAGLAMGLTLAGMGLDASDAWAKHKHKHKKKKKKGNGCEYIECQDEGEVCFPGNDLTPCCACRECRHDVGDRYTCQDPDD